MYKAALVCPLLWACDVDLDVLDITSRFMRGTFNFDPLDSAAAMPRWSLNVLMKYLRSSHFEPLELATPVKLTQKLIALILLSSGRRKGELSHISRVSRDGPEELELRWTPGFMPKRHSPNFQPPCPSIWSDDVTKRFRLSSMSF